MLGEGGFASVILVVDSKGKLFALKSVEKKLLVENPKLKHRRISQIYNEKNIHLSLQNRFCISMYVLHAKITHQVSFLYDRFNSFQQERSVKFVLEFAPGGDLFSLIQNTTLTNQQRQHFLACAGVIYIFFLYN